MENKKLQTGGETTNTDSSNDFFNYVDNIFKTQILPKKDIEPALPKIEDLDIDLDLIKKVDEPDLGWKSAKEEFLTDTFEIGTSDEELKRIKNFDFSLRDGDNRYQRRYDNMNWGSNLLRTVGNYAATGMEIATGMAGGLWEGGEELVDEVSEQTGLDIYNNKEFGKNWLLSASDWLRESKPEIYDRDGVEQGEGNFWEQLKDIKSLDLGDIYKAGSVLPSVFGSMAVAIPLTAVIMPSSIAAGAAVGGVPGAVVGGFMGKTAVAAALAYAEGMMDAKDVYKEKYDEIFEKTMDANYAENVAKTAANKNLLYNTALNTPLNLIEVGFLTKYLKKPAFKSFDTFNPDKLHGRYKPTLLAGETTEDYIARMARNEIRDSSGNVIGYKSNLNRSFTEFLKDIPDDIGYNIRNKKEFIGRHYDDILSPLSEGLEEYNNFWSREKGMENVDTKLSIAGMLSDGTSYLPEFAQNMKEGEGVFDILSGMLGAVVTNPIMTNVHIKRDKIYDPISNTYKFKYDRSDLNPFKETDFFQFGKKEADKKDMKSYIERSIDNIRTTKKLFSDFNNSPDIETKSHLLDQMMIQPITEAISSNTLNTKIATYQEGLNMLQEKRNEPLENKLDFLSTTDKTNVQNLMLKLSTASEQVEIDTINGQLDNYNKTANKHIELQSKTIKENIDYLNQLNTAYVSLYSQKQTENDYGYLNELFKAQFSYDQELKFRTKLERDLESRITELTSLAPNKNEALMSLENDTEFNQAQDNLLASEIRAMQFGARLNMLRRGEFLEDTHNILEQDLIDKIETYKIDSSEILAYKKYVRLKSLPERFQESIKGELKRMEENELKSFFEFKNNYNQLIELQNKKAKEDNESAIYKYIKRSQKVADLHHKLAKNKVEFDNFYKLIDSTSAYFKYFTEFGDFGYDELISNLTSQLAMKDWYSNYLTFYNAVIQDIELFEVNNPTLSSDYKGRIIHLKKQIKTNHLRITQFYIIQSTKFKKRNIIDDILGYLNSNQKPVSGKLPWNYEDLLNNIKSEFGITVDEDGTYQTNRVNYVIQYEDKFHIAKNESKKIEYDFNTNSFISVEYINEFKRNDPKLIVISKRTTPLNYNDDYIDLSSGTLLKDFLKENGLTLTLVNEYNIDVVNGVNLNIFTEDKDNKKRQLIFIKEALASKDKSPDISKLSNDSKDIYNKIKKALEDTTNSLVLSDSGNTPIDRNNLDNIIEIMQNDLTLEIINERFTEEEIKDMMEGKDEAIENIIKVLTDGELPDTKNLREIYNKYFKEIDGIKSAFIDDDEYDIKESYNKWGGILITHIFKSIESMDLKSKIDIAHRLRKSIGSENADSVKDLHYQLFFYYIGDEKILSEIKDELIHNINDMKKSVFEIEPELIDGDYDKIINGNEKEVEGLIESYQGFYKAIKFINKLRQIEGELFSDFDRIIDEENQIFNDKDKTLLKARFNKDKLNEYYDNWINSLGVQPKETIPNVEAKIADIESKTKEELFPIGSLHKGKESGNTLKVIGYTKDGVRFQIQTEGTLKPTRNVILSELKRLIKEGKLTSDVYAELKALEQQPTTSNQSEIEAKKADIERRRQEELLKIGNEAIPKEIQEFFSIDNSGQKVKVTYTPVPSKSMSKILTDWFERNIPDVKVKDFKTGKGSIHLNITLKGLSDWQNWELPIISTMGGSGYFVESNLSEWGKVLINAKYDAEYIDKVKKGEFTKQQAKDALKEINRLTPELEKQIDDAELDALEETSGVSGSALKDVVEDVKDLTDKQKNLIKLMRANQTKIEAKKADIERRNTFTRKDLKTISEGTALAKKGSEVIDTKKVESTLSIGDKITFFAEKERKGIWDGKAVRDEKDNPWGLIGILGSNDGWLRNDTKYDAELKALEQQDAEVSNQTKIDPNSNFKFEINSVIYDSIEELFKHDSSYINLNSTIKVLDEKDNVIKEIPLTVNNKLIKDILLDDDILIRDMMSKRREEVLKLLTNTSSTDPIKYNFNKLVKLIEFEYLFGIFEIDDIEHYDTYNKVVLFLNKLKGSGDIIVDTSTNVPSFKFNIGTKNEKNYDGLKIPEDVEIFQLVQLKDTELKKAFYENYKYEDKYYYDEKTNKLTFKNKNDFNKVRAGYYTEDDGTNSEFPYAKTRKIFPSVIDWALYKKNPLLYLKHKKRGINLDGETNLINSTSLKFNTDAYKNKLIKSFQLLKSTPKIFEFTYKDSTETEIRIRIEKSENGEFTVITDLDEKSGLSRHESLKVDGTYTFYLDDNKENMLFQIIENKVETSSFKYENAKKVLDDIIKEMTDENNIAEWEDEKFSRFYSDIDVTMYNKFLYVIRELRANLFLLGNPIIKDIIYYFTDFGDSIYLDSNRNAVKFEFRNELPYDIPINNLIDFTRSLFEDFNLDDFNVVVKGLSEVKLESLVDIKTLTFYKNQVKHITESESNYLLWLKQYFYYLHKYNPNKQREIQVGNKLYKLNDSVRLKDSKNLVHITDISNENGIPKFNNVVFDSDLHEAEVFSENDNELIKGDKIYIFKNNEWRIKSEGDIEEIDEDLRNLLEDFRNKEIININNKDKNADLLVNNSVRFVDIINNRLRNGNEKLLINEFLIENEIENEVFKSIIQNNKQDILNFVFRKSDSKFDDSDVHIQVPDEDLSNKIKKDALSKENYDALAYVLTNEGKLIPQNGGIVENDFRSFEVDANKINTDIKAFFNGEILNFKENGKAIIEVRSVKVTTKFEEISIGDNNSLELLVTSNAVELFILINHYLDPKGELDLLNNLNEKDVNELKTKANIYARIRILLDGVGIDQPIEKYIKDNFEDIHTLYKNVIQVVQIETDEVETDKSVHLGYLHDLTHYFKSNDIEKAYSMIVNYYNKVLSKFIKNDFQLKFKVRIENEGYLIASDKEDSFLVNYPKITKVYRFKGHGKDVKLHEFDVKNGKFKQVLLDVFEEKELKAIITEFLLIEDSNTDKVPDKEDLILMIETYLKNKDTINTAFFTILDNQFSFNKRILKLNNNKWDSIKENDKNLYQHYFDLFLGTLQKGTTNENIKSIIDNLFILYKDYGVSESEYANDKSKEVIELLQSKIDNESYYKNIVLPIYVVKNGNDFVFKLIGKIGDVISVLELTRTNGEIKYKTLEYNINTEKLAEKIQDKLAKTIPLNNDGYIEWLELMFPYIPIDIDMASFNKVDFGGSEIERFKLSYFTNTKSIEGNNFTNPLVKLDLREVEPYKTKSDKVDSAKIIDENITTKNLNLRTSLTELSSNTKGFSKGDVDSVILKILNVTSTQNEEAFNLILNEFKPLQVILQDFEDKIKITSISQTTFINNFKEFFKKNRGNINQFLIEKSNGDDSNNIESCI